MPVNYNKQTTEKKREKESMMLKLQCSLEW